MARIPKHPTFPLPIFTSGFECSVHERSGRGQDPLPVEQLGNRSRRTEHSKPEVNIGDAGGFVAALSHDGLHAAIQSARIAVDTCRTALTSEQPQDALAEFDHKWRHDLVEFLRLPNADLRFLVPLVFTNELMAKKLASAFIAGTNL